MLDITSRRVPINPWRFSRDLSNDSEEDERMLYYMFLIERHMWDTCRALEYCARAVMDLLITLLHALHENMCSCRLRVQFKIQVSVFSEGYIVLAKAKKILRFLFFYYLLFLLFCLKIMWKLQIRDMISETGFTLYLQSVQCHCLTDLVK